MGALAALVDRAGLAADTPVSLARIDGSGRLEQFARGTWPDGRPVVTSDRFYVASLAKQVTGVAMAVLVADRRLDPDAPISKYLAALPHWCAEITPRQLAHHVAGLPPAGELEAELGSDAWTEATALARLAARHEPGSPPGQTFAYSNVGYVLLARVIGEVAGEAFPDFARKQLFSPLGIDDMDFAGHEVGGFPQLPLLGALPLTVGDGGLWASAGAFVRWLDAQNSDALGFASLVETPYRFGNGAEGDYGWGIGCRTFRDAPLFVHGGQWTGAVARALRSHSLGIAVVALAAGPEMEAVSALADAMLGDSASG